MISNKAVIYFNSKSKEYSWLSNFYPSPILLRGNWWPTVEHFFQAQKFSDENYTEQIRTSLTPRDAKRMGRSRKFEIHPNWEHLRCDVMREALGKKFADELLRTKLIATTPQRLVEDSASDYFWGCGRTRTGKNVLGQMLIELRDGIEH